MNSNVKNSDLVQVLALLKNSEEFIKSHTHQEKKKTFYLFITFLFTPN